MRIRKIKNEKDTLTVALFKPCCGKFFLI